MYIESIDFSNPYFYIWILFGASFLTLFIYYWLVFVWLAFYRKRKTVSTEKKQAVSVVICARNEYKNLRRHLNLILEQDYPDYEVIVVNHGSTDNSYYLLQNYATKYKNLKLVELKENLNFFFGKKFPLTLGIKSATNDIILLTDADCKPKSKNWIDSMQSNFVDKNEIVLAYGGYETGKGILNKLIRYDTLHVAIQYFSFSLMGSAYMGVGRNLAYRKSLFFSNQGFTSHYNVKSGDDDLFINKASNKKNTTIEIDKDSHTLSIPEKSIKSWILQKKRHLTTGRLYKLKHRISLGLYLSALFLFYTLFFVLLGLQYNILSVLSLFILKLISQLIIFKRSMIKLDEKQLLLYTPIFEIFLVYLNPILSFFNIFTKQSKWK